MQAENSGDVAGQSLNDDVQALRACVVEAGIMTIQEVTQALSLWQRQAERVVGLPPPYILLDQPSEQPTAALRWDWDLQRAHEFATWCTACLRDRFGIRWSVDCMDEDANLGPRYLRLTLDGRQEHCDWRYLNQSHWMGAFCTIADRLLNPQGLTALSLETGWFDTIIVFCRLGYADELLRWFPEAE